MATSLYSPDFLAIFNANRDTGGPRVAGDVLGRRLQPARNAK
jgi:hypothetical protein